MTSTEAAALLGASPTSVKRWADSGLLPCVKTAGNHRRFTREALEAFVHRESDVPSQPAGAPDLLEMLLSSGVPAIHGRLLTERAECGSWAEVCDRLGPTISAMGSAWADGHISVIDEHVATGRLTRALANVAEFVAVAPGAPVALLVAAEGDEHTLGLALAEVTLREAGWRTLWSGRGTPTELLSDAVHEHEVRLIAVSASSYSSDEVTLARYAAALAEVAREARCELIFGGSGAWPEPLPEGTVIRSFRAFSDTARLLLRPVG